MSAAKNALPSDVVRAWQIGGCAPGTGQTGAGRRSRARGLHCGACCVSQKGAREEIADRANGHSSKFRKKRVALEKLRSVTHTCNMSHSRQAVFSLELEESQAMITDMRGRLQDYEAVREILEEAGRSKAQTADLCDAQLYLTKTDLASDAEFLAMVELINSQIFQSAAQIADFVDFESAAPHHAPLFVAGAKEKTSPLVGETLLVLLEIVRHRHYSFAL
ncbi:hypothetical protein WOLCODRAFT_167076 [Wolfiporia cocos MD-104 SS10]|uniref:Uncharacterized protein n=1 Tax=Wolfiporia cocos (strain MD-104) TaxID=742152 RepID=A0A2H3J373_WOLCO|nr:hypothetical protein WOLCODRAFT_167076 [Wolfiporia cocos MD-104 SS10]